ncbi:nucleolar pre-ribosomal-associated protein 1 [Halyomorpha halys]|uniref:nucleolar pre-ribosomal-associated protein 1 n=1 Tax=Halyomorpha halys TaxID=286706 RepID=UPI0006D4E831|nr:nucleolar pre-ribosomal-associated protein 1 [Halyomorpha halys]
MDNPKKRKEDLTTEIEKKDGGSFSSIQLSADELRKNLGNPEVIDLVKGYFLKNKDENKITNYINAGGSVSEICQLLTNMDLKKRDQTCVIFEALQLIIIKSITEFPDQDQLKDDCKQLIANYIGEFQSLLTSKTSVKNKKIILRLLAVLATVSTSLASLILLSLTLTKEDVEALVEHFDPLDEKSLRVAFIHFLLAFVIEQSPKVIEKLLGKKVWIPSIFPGLQYDSPFNVKLVVTTLEGRIIDNKDLSKTSKLYVFNTMSLIHLSELYNWNPKSWYDKKSNKMTVFNGQISDDDKIEIRTLIHGLLLKITTSVKYGIAFHDPTYGTSNIQRNYTISNFLQKFSQPWEDNLKRDLLHQIIRVCPDLLKPVLTSFQPRLKVILPNWLQVLDLIIEVAVDVNFDLRNVDPKSYLTIVQDLIVPHQILEAISNGLLLNAKNSQEKLTVLKLLLIILNRYKDVSVTFSEELKDYSSVQANIAAYLINNLPKSHDIFHCLKLSYSNMEYDVVKELIKLLTLYEDICPEVVDIIRYDDTISNWVKECITGSESSESCNISLLLSMIRLEIIVNPQDTYQEQCLDRFKYTTMGKEESDIRLGLEILKEFLYKSGIFIRNEKELSLWIYCMEKYFHCSIGSTIAESLKWALENMNTVYRTLLEVQEYSEVDALPGLNLDDFLKLSVNDDVSSLDNSVDSMFNLSPLLPSLLHCLCDNVPVESNDFLIAFIAHYLHRQVSIQPYIILLKKYKSPTVEKIIHYTESWLNAPTSINIPPFNKSVYYNASRSVLDGKKFDYDAAKDILNDLKGRELLLEKCIFMACELSRLGQATPARLEQISSLVRFCLTDTCLQVPMNHPTLLANFHPMMDVGDSDLTNLVIMISEHCNLSPKTIAPFSHRLSFELKYAKSICYNLEDDSKLKKLLKIFKFSKSDVEDLINYVFTMKAKYFERSGKLSPWASVLIHLLNEAVELNIIMNEKSLKGLIIVLIKLIEKEYDVSEICNCFLKYLKALEVDISGTLLDSFKVLFVVMSTAAIWYEDLCVFIYLLLDKVDYTNISVDRAVTLLASLEKFKKRHKEVVSDSSQIIFNGLCSRPSPKWLVGLRKIIDALLPPETCKKTCKYVRKKSKEIFTSTESLLVIKEIFKKSEEMLTLFTLVIDWLSEELNKPDGFDQEQSEEMCKILIETLQGDIDSSGLSAPDNDFVMHLLLEGLRLPSQFILDLLLCLLEKKLIKLPPNEVFELLTSHSCFLDVILGKDISAKYSCLKLILELVSKDNSLINSKHVPVLLSCYGATLSKLDQIILKILYIYERVGGINLAGWKPYVWGEAAIDHYSIRTKLSSVKLNHSITLDLFEKDLVLNTIREFPLDRRLNGDYDKNVDSIYDPAFYLPLLSQVASEKNLGWKLAGSGALALTLAALASSDPEVRLAAYHVLHRMYTNIEQHKDNLIWRHFIEAVRGGIVDLKENDNVRLSSIITTFLGRASIIMAFPDDYLYFSLHNFIFAKPHLKLNTVPAFFEMFHHTQGNQKLHQRWLLEVIKDGIREQRDLQLALNCLSFKFILDFHSCNLASPKTKQLIEELVAKCVQFVDEKQLLINNYSIIPWISVANSNLINNLPHRKNAQYKPLIDFIKQRT